MHNKPTLALAKYSIRSQEILVNVINVYNALSDRFDVTLILFEREADFYIPHIPIFSPNELMEFHEYGVALDVPAAKLMERTPIENKFYLPTETSFEKIKMTKIQSLEEVI